MNYNLAISRFKATGIFNVTKFIIYYDGFNISTSKYLGTIDDPDIVTKSQVYMNSSILDVYKD